MCLRLRLPGGRWRNYLGLRAEQGDRSGDPDKQSVERKYPGLALELREKLACALWTQQGESWGGGGAKPKNSRW